MWGAPGAQGPEDRGSAVLATLSADAFVAISTSINAAGIALVQSWVDDPAVNFGMIIASQSSEDGVDFFAREAGSPVNRPALEIAYIESGGPGNLSPTITIDRPADGASFLDGEAVTIAADALDIDGDVTLVEFFAGNNRLGVDDTTPFEFIWTDVALGSYALTAVATDNAGSSTTSPPVHITVEPPTNTEPSITLVQPLHGATFTSGESTTLIAEATDSDGNVTLVEFFDNGVKTGEDGSEPYQITWDAVSAGTHVLTARATDDLGASTTSASINVLVSSDVRHVYLTWQGNTSTTMTVNYQTGTDPGTSSVYYDTVPRGGRIAEYTLSAGGQSHEIAGLDAFVERTIHVVELTGLSPGESYYFVAGDAQSGFSEERKFRTVPNGDEAIRFIAAGDMGVAAASRDLQVQAAAQNP